MEDTAREHFTGASVVQDAPDDGTALHMGMKDQQGIRRI
jgi:hypothetical protein